jgi:hypothetical protein
MTNDDEIVAKLDASDRAMTRMTLALGGAVLLLAAVYAAAAFSGKTALLQSEGVQIAIAALFAMIVAFAFLRFGQKFRPDAYSDAADPRIVRRRIDAHHRYWRWTLLAGILSTSVLGLNFGYVLADLTRADRILALLAGGIMIVVIALFSVLTLIGPGWFNRELHAILNDDFVRDLRARTARLGYLTMMAATAAALLATIWRPDLALSALAWAFYAGFAVPALYYIIADWRAGREM